MKTYWLGVGVGCALIAGVVFAQSTFAQPAAPRVVQTPDGTLYVIVPEGRLWLIPQQISFEELTPLADIGALIGELPMPQPPAAPPPPPVAPPPPPPAPAPAPAPAAAPAPAPAPPEQPITLTGQRDVNTRPFTLVGGNYTARWSAQAPAGSSSCFHGARLTPVAAGTRFIFESVGSGQVAGGQPISGETQVYRVPAGEYYVDAISNCNWTITIAPLR